jgi:hypothetical protein
MTDRNPQSASASEDAADLVVPLLKATLDPASKRATRPIDSPAGRIVSQVARRDLDTGAADGILHLATDVASTLFYLVPGLAEALGHDPDHAAAALAAALRHRGAGDVGIGLGVGGAVGEVQDQVEHFAVLAVHGLADAFVYDAGRPKDSPGVHRNVVRRGDGTDERSYGHSAGPGTRSCRRPRPGR